MQRRDGGWRLRWAILVAGDVLACVLAYLGAFILRSLVPLPLTQGYLPGMRFAEVQHHWVEMILAQLGALYFFGLYEVRALTSPREYLGPLLAAPIVQSLILVAVYFFAQDLTFPRSIFVVLTLLNGAAMVGWRIGSRSLLGSYPRRRVLVVGSNNAASEVVNTIRVQSWLGMDVVGTVGSDGTRPPSTTDVPVLGVREELPTLCQRHDVDDVIIASDLGWQDRLIDEMSRWHGPRARISVVPSPYEVSIGRPGHLRLHDIPLIEVVTDPLAGAASGVKRVFDLVVAIPMFALALPVMLIVAVLVRVSSSGPVIYTQQRVGKDGRPFTMIKFRTMRRDAERGTGPILAAENDPRVTWLGRFLRATRLDELPQLWNLLRGDMSFVGPRPERPEFVAQYVKDIQGYGERFRVRPGLTGYAQVNGEYHTSPTTKLKYDLAYIHNHSLWLDLKILSETVKVILTRRGV